jgi:phosphohistidine phosphatase SixA
VGPLLEAARVDPDLMARSEAVRAIARIDPATGDTATRLHDLWSTSDDALREDIARAYLSPSIAASGGAEELRGLLAAGHGPGVVSVASSVIMGSRTSPRGAPSFNDEMRKSAVALLVRTIDDATRRERLLALAMAPLSNADVRAAVKRATAETNDLETRESALSRLLEVPAERDAAKKELYAFASPSSPAGVARRARLALASEGELSVQAWLESDLKNVDAATKLLAATGLVTLHRGARATLLLADPDAHVRTSAACTLLASHR